MNYNIIVDTSNFKPYDITPALAMLRDYRDAYYRIEDQFNKIAEERGKLMLSQQDSPDAYNKLQDYDQSFSDFVKDFSHGMNLQNAAWARQLRGQYSKDILPIKEAVDRYNKIQDQVSKLGPDAIYVNGIPSFDSVYKSGALNQALQYRSSATESQNAAAYFKGIFNSNASKPILEEISQEVANQYLYANYNGDKRDIQELAVNGILNRVVQNPESALGKAFNAYMDGLHMENYTQEAKNQLAAAVTRGMLSAVPMRDTVYANHSFDQQMSRERIALSRESMNNTQNYRRESLEQRGTARKEKEEQKKQDKRQADIDAFKNMPTFTTSDGNTYYQGESGRYYKAADVDKFVKNANVSKPQPINTSSSEYQNIQRRKNEIASETSVDNGKSKRKGSGRRKAAWEEQEEQKGKDTKDVRP